MERKFFDAGGAKLSYLRRRGKYPVVFIHGFTASSEIWSPLVSLLNPDLDLIMVDLFGHGQSGTPDWDFGSMDVQEVIRLQATAISSLIENLELKDLTVVGSSLGGWIAIELVSRFKTHSRLALIDSAGVAPMSDDAFSTGFRLLAELYKMQENAMSPMLDGVLDAKNDAITLVSDESLSRLNHSVSVIWGSEDPILKESHGKRLSERISGSRFYSIDGAGHTPFTTNPEAVAAIINEMVESGVTLGE